MEAHPSPLTARCHAQRGGEVGLAQAWMPDQQHRLGQRNVVAFGKGEYLRSVEARHQAEVEVGQFFAHGKACQLEVLLLPLAVAVGEFMLG